MGFNHLSNKTMVETVNRLVALVLFSSGAQEQLPHLIWLQQLFYFLGSRKETVYKSRVIVPVSGNLTIETNRTYTTPSGNVNTYSKEKYCQTQL
jgi:hypothetical protein